MSVRLASKPWKWTTSGVSRRSHARSTSVPVVPYSASVTLAATAPRANSHARSASDRRVRRRSAAASSAPSPGPPAVADRSTVDRRKALLGMKHADDARQALRVGADERLGQRDWPVVNDRNSYGNPCFASRPFPGATEMVARDIRHQPFSLSPSNPRRAPWHLVLASFEVNHGEGAWLVQARCDLCVLSPASCRAIAPGRGDRNRSCGSSVPRRGPTD